MRACERRERSDAAHLSANSSVQESLVALHDATTFKTLWAALLSLIHAAIPVEEVNFGIGLDCGRPSMVFSTTSGFGPESWERTFRGLDEMEQSMRGTVVNLIRCSEVVESGASKGSLSRKDGLFDDRANAVGFFFRRGKLLDHALFLRPLDSRRDLDDAEIWFLESLHAHIETALRRVLGLNQEKARMSALGKALREEHTPVFVLDWNCRFIFSSAEGLDASNRWSNIPRRSRLIPDQRLPMAVLKEIDLQKIQLRVAGRGDIGFFGRNATRRSVVTAPDGKLRAIVVYLKPRNSPVNHGCFMVRFSVARCDGTSVLETWEENPRFTAGEQTVIELVCSGAGNSEIATALCLSVHTVRAHLRSIFRKLGVRSRGQMIVRLAKG